MEIESINNRNRFILQCVVESDGIDVTKNHESICLTKCQEDERSLRSGGGGSGIGCYGLA